MRMHAAMHVDDHTAAAAGGSVAPAPPLSTHLSSSFSYSDRGRKHFPCHNQPSAPAQLVVKPKKEYVFTSLEDRPRGKHVLHEDDVYLQAKLAAAAKSVSGCKHFPSAQPHSQRSTLANIGWGGEQKQFVTGGKTVDNRAQALTSAETTIEQTFGHLARLSEAELNRRNGLHLSGAGLAGGIEYTPGFYRMGACVPCSDMSRSRGAKSQFDFEGQNLRAKLTSEKLWKQNRLQRREVDARKMRSYAEVEAERALDYERRLVESLPEEMKAPVEDFAPPPEPAPAPVPVAESRREKKLREKKTKMGTATSAAR